MPLEPCCECRRGHASCCPFLAANPSLHSKSNSVYKIHIISWIAATAGKQMPLSLIPLATRLCGELWRIEVPVPLILSYIDSGADAVLRSAVGCPTSERQRGLQLWLQGLSDERPQQL